MTLTDRFIAAMHEDRDALGSMTASTSRDDFVPQMQSAVLPGLKPRGPAYLAGNVTSAHSGPLVRGPGLSVRKVRDDLRAGRRVDVAADKQDRSDCPLEAYAREDEPEAWGLSPRGGRPGWRHRSARR